MKIQKTILASIVLLLSFLWANSQTDKLNKIEVGWNSTYFFDERGFQFGDYIFPIDIHINTLAYSKYFKDPRYNWQIKIIVFETKNRMFEYDEKRILYKSFFESYGYTMFYINRSVLNKKWFKFYINSGLTCRSGGENYNVYFSTWESVTDDRLSTDFGISVGGKFETKNLCECNRIYFYFQPQYNFYFYRQDKNFLQNEIIGNFGLGYKFNTKKKK